MVHEVTLEHRITALEIKVDMLEQSIRNLQRLMIANFSATVTIIIALAVRILGGG